MLADTAGLRPNQIGKDGQEGIESEGIKRALKRAEEADITVLLFDGGAEEIDTHTLNLIDERSVLVVNKMDVAGAENDLSHALSLSVHTGDGLDELMDALLVKIKTLMDDSREVPSLTRQRHRGHVEEALAALERSQGAALPELMAEDARLAIRALGRITGKVDVEDLLDVIFRDFCIGK